jgi:CRP/FNR family transcriptional regulator
MKKYGDVKEVPVGTTLLRTCQTIRSIIMVLDGVVKLYQESDEGDEYFIYYIQPGQACALIPGVHGRTDTSGSNCHIEQQFF